MKNVKASIITVGDELLIGQVIDTNSATMAQMLNKAGISVVRRTAIGDNGPEIIGSLNEEISRADIVLLTGGLGPTSDDITKKTLCKYFKSKLITDKKALENVHYLYHKIYKKEISKVNLAQAQVPACCEVIQNKRGSAPCMIFRKNKTFVISMPGVPYEMEGIMEDVIHYLQKQFDLPKILHKTIITHGIGESSLAELIRDFEKQLPKKIRLAYLPGLGILRLRLSASAKNAADEKDFNNQFLSLKKKVKPFTINDTDDPLQAVLGKLLLKRSATVATAESCTGGRIASLITSINGSSAYFHGAIVSYANNVKEKQLGVKKTSLKDYGAVSEQVVIEMKDGILQKMNTGYAIAVSGIMGPGGGSEEKPVGTVWICVGNREKHFTKKMQFRFDRLKNIESTAAEALSMLIEFLRNQDK